MKPIFNRRTLIKLTALSALCWSTWASAETIRIANGDWAPYLAENLKENGVISHAVKEAFALEGIQVEYTFLPWKRGYEEAKEGKLDASIVWGHTDERAQDFDYSDTVVDLETILFIKKDSTFDWKEPEDLGKVSIGGVIGYSYKLEDLEKAGKVTITRIASPENNYKKLVSGRLDTVAEDREVGWDLIHTLGLADQIKTHPKPLFTKPYYLIMSKKSPNGARYLEAFNRGLKKLKDSGRFDQMMKDSQEGKYKQSPRPQPRDKSWLSVCPRLCCAQSDRGTSRASHRRCCRLSGGQMPHKAQTGRT